MEAEGALAQSEVAANLEQLDAGFRRLMASYATALGEAQCVQRAKAGSAIRKATEPASVTQSKIAWFGPLVRLLVGSHLRKRLNDLAARFSQIEPSLSQETEAAACDWLSTRRALVEDMATGLPSLKVPGIFVVASPIVAFVTAASQLSTTAWVFVILFVFFPAVSAGTALIKAYRRKRELFLADATAVDRRPPEVQSDYTGRNLYRLEEEIFSMLGSRRRPEMEIDGFTIAWGCILIAELCFLAPLLLDSSSTAVGFIGLGAGFAVLFVNVWIAYRLPKRVWK